MNEIAIAQTLFTTQEPTQLHQSDGSNINYELGTRFQSAVSGQITAIRFWKDAGENGTHTGRIWSASGQLLVSVNFMNETSSGWQQRTLSTPLAISANATYVVSVNTRNSFYVATQNGLGSQVVNGSLRTLVGNNGVYGTSGQFPNNSFSDTNYFRDISFTPNISLTSFTVSPASIAGGSFAIGTVTLSNPAPSGGAVVHVVSDSATVIVPASVTMEQGATTVAFTVASSAVGSLTLAQITATYSGTQTASLTITPPVLSSVLVNPTALLGGNSASGTVLLSGSAPASGVHVNLSSDNVAAVVPASLMIAPGAISANFAISTVGVRVLSSVTITGNLNGTRSGILTITPAVLSTLVLNPSAMVAGNASAAALTLTGIAPPGGAVVALASDNINVSVPAAVTVAAGTTSTIFPVTTSAVSAGTSATISATYLGTQTARLNVDPAAVSSLLINPNNIPGGTSSSGSVLLSGPAPPGGAIVALSADNAIASGIEGVYSPAGLPSAGLFDWSTFGTSSLIDSNTFLTIPGERGVSLSISTATGLQMQVLTNCAVGADCGWYGNFAEGASIFWTNGTYHSDTGWWASNGPLTIRFSSPQRGFGFQVMGDELGPFRVTLCAYNATDTLLGCVPFNGNATGTADNSATFVGLYDDAQEITRVTVDGGGLLYSHDFAMGSLYVTATRRELMPDAVTVPAGATSANFPITTNAVSTVTNVDITATYNGTQTAALTIDPAVLSSITLNPSSVIGGTALIGTATLSGTAPAGGVAVALSADNPVSIGTQTVNDLSGMPQDGSVTWTDFGPSFTSVNSGSSLAVSGLPGLTVTTSTTNGLPSMILTACPAIADCGWSGNFIPAAPLFWPGGVYDEAGNWMANGPLTITLSTPQRGVGFNVMADETGPFSGNLCAYNSRDVLLGCVPFQGNGAPFAGGTNGFAPFAGVYDDTPEIAKVVVDAGGVRYPHDFAISNLVIAAARRMVPSTVKIEGGATSGTFPVNTDILDTLTTIQVTGNYQTTRTASLEVFPGTTPFSISGIIAESGIGGGVTVTLSGAASGVTTTTNSGFFTFAGLIDGTYTVTPVKTGYTFVPASRQVTLATGSVVGLNFMVLTHHISGTISGAGQTMVAITGTTSMTVGTSGPGTYISEGLSAGTYTVTPTSPGYTFYPANRVVIINGADAVNVNFTALPEGQTFTISGTVTATGGGAVVSLSGAANAMVTANSDGSYSFSGLASGNYTITPSKNAINFGPTSQSMALDSGTDVNNVSFNASIANVTIFVSPTPALVISGGTLVFSATVTGTPNTAVIWSATAGTISVSGLYTAPATPGTFTISATTLADNTKSAAAIVNIVATDSTSVLLGDQNVEAQIDATLPLGQAEAFQVIANSSGNVQSLAVYLDPSSTVSQLFAGLYADNNGHPGILLNQGSSTQLTQGAWNTLAIPPTSVAVGSSYWIAILGTADGTLVFRRSAATGCASEISDQNLLTLLPSSWITGSATSSCGSSAFGDSTKVFFFDTFSSTTLSSNWKIVSRHGSYAQAETECNIPQQVGVNNGLTIRTAVQNSTCGDFHPDGTVWRAPGIWPYVTGDIQWSNLNFTYGTVEIRAKLPSRSTGVWPATWLLGANCQATNPYNGDAGVGTCPNIGQNGYTEIDMTECYGNTWCQFHIANPNFGMGGGCDTWDYVPDSSFHTFKTVWDASRIRQYRDDVLITACNTSMNRPMFLIIQTQTGGIAGTPNDSFLPADFVVDYVKVTQP